MADQQVGEGRAVTVLGQVFVPMFKYGPDIGRNYALIELGDRYYPLVFRNPALGEGADWHLNGLPVNFLARGTFAEEVSGGECDERGFLCFRDQNQGWAWFIDCFTRMFPGLLTESKRVAGILV